MISFECVMYKNIDICNLVCLQWAYSGHIQISGDGSEMVKFYSVVSFSG